MKDYEIDYDDDGNEIKVRITKDVLKRRLADAENRASKWYEAYSAEAKAVRAAKQRIDNAYWCAKLASVLDDGRIHAVNPNVSVSSSSVDVTGRHDSFSRYVAGETNAVLSVEFTGDPETLLRFGNYLTGKS